MFRKLLASFFALCTLTLFLQKAEAATTEDKLPEIFYATPREYKIADIAVTGMENYEDYVLIGLSNLSVGQVIKVPGDEITEAMKRYWKHGLFSDVKIMATKIQGSQVWLEIQLKPRPQISAVKYSGIKKSDKDDLENSIGLTVGNQISPNIADKAKVLIKRHYDEKGFKNAEVDITQKEDPADKTKVIVEVNIDRKDKIKINQIIFDGNVAFTDSKAARAMKKTKQKGRIENLFSSKKFVEAEYEKDKLLLIQRYNEFGYRDAMILEDTVYKFDEKTVNVYIKIEEGKRYFFRNIDWVGNTVYSSSELNRQLQITKGDVYNQKRLHSALGYLPPVEFEQNLRLQAKLPVAQT